MNLRCKHCQPARRSLTAATDAIGLYVLSALCTNWKCLPEIATAPLGPRNDKSGAFTIVTATGTSRSCGAGRGQPGPYKARAFARRSVQIGSAFPRLPRPRWGLAMTNLLTLRHRIRAAKPTARKAVTDRLVQSHSTAGGRWCTAALPDVSLRGAKRRGNLAVHSWITGRPRRKRNCLPEIATAPLGPRNDKSEAFTIVTATGTSRSCGAGRGQPGPYKARAFARRSVQIGSAFPRLPRAQSALAMTNLEALCIPRSMIHSTLAHPA